MNVIEFYKDRISQFEAERHVFTKYLAMITPGKGDLHMLDWEIRQHEDARNVLDKNTVSKLQDEVTQSEQELSESKAELQNMRSSQNNRSLQIAKLSELAQPVQKDTTYIIPDKFPHTAATTASPQKDPPGHSSNLSDSNRHLRSIKTAQILALESDLEIWTKRASFNINGLFTEIALAEETAREMGNQSGSEVDSKKIEVATMINDIDALDYQCFLSVSELLRLRHSIMISQRLELEELERLNSDKISFEKQEYKAKSELELDLKLMKKRVKSELVENTKDLKRQAQSISDEIELLTRNEQEMIKSQNRVAKQIEKLSEKRALEEKKYESYRRFHLLDMEGFRAETNLLQQRLESLRKAFELKERNAKKEAAIQAKREEIAAAIVFPRNPFDGDNVDNKQNIYSPNNKTNNGGSNNNSSKSNNNNSKSMDKLKTKITKTSKTGKSSNSNIKSGLVLMSKLSPSPYSSGRPSSATAGSRLTSSPSITSSSARPSSAGGFGSADREIERELNRVSEEIEINIKKQLKAELLAGKDGYPSKKLPRSGLSARGVGGNGHAGETLRGRLQKEFAL